MHVKGLSLSYFGLIKILLPLIYYIFIGSLILYFYILIDERNSRDILKSQVFEVVIFFLPFISLIIAFYILTEYKNPFFSFSLIIFIFSYISLNIKIEFRKEISLLLFVLSLFFISSSITLYIDSEKMLFVRSIKDIFYSWNTFAKFILFFNILILFVSLLNSKKFIFYISCFMLPVIYFWDTITLPDVSLPDLYFYLTLAFLISLLFLFFIYNLINIKLKIFYFFIIFIPLFLSRDFSSFYYVNKDRFFIIQENIKKEKGKTMEPETITEKKQEINGKKIFEEVCSSCHSFEEKIVGPAFKDVIPKYYSDKEKLLSFIKNPYKINPDLPPMPELGLKDKEIKAVIDYIFEEVKKYEE